MCFYFFSGLDDDDDDDDDDLTRVIIGDFIAGKCFIHTCIVSPQKNWMETEVDLSANAMMRILSHLYIHTTVQVVDHAHVIVCK